MKLVKPNTTYAESFTEALIEFDQAAIRGFWNWKIPITDIEQYITRTQAYANGESLPEGMVPSTTYWLIDNDQFVAHVNIRHTLTPRLSLIGGHIGYAVRPSMHGKGYGSELLRLALPKAAELGLENALITCDIDNAPSLRIIEKNGGVLRDQILVQGRPVCRYLVRLK